MDTFGTADHASHWILIQYVVHLYSIALHIVSLLLGVPVLYDSMYLYSVPRLYGESLHFFGV